MYLQPNEGSLIPKVVWPDLALALAAFERWMMKLSEELRRRRHDDITMQGHSTVGMDLIREAEQLEAENEALRMKARQVVDGAHGGGFDKFSGHDDYVVPYQLIDELQDALLEGDK